MDLPKNIVQIGKPDKLHKIFVEDYVISYIKQLNRRESGKSIGIALYGRRCVEDNVRYYFLYGATQISGLEGRGQYLSELERESIETKQRDYFEGYDFLAWCTINGEMPDGFYIHEQGKGLLIDGYACFYEKNESMLNFMLIMGNKEKEIKQKEQDAQKTAREMAVGSIDNRIKSREGMERPVLETAERRPQSQGRARSTLASNRRPDKSVYGIKVAVVGVAIMLCIVGVSTLNDPEKMKELQVVARQVKENLNEKKIPDKEEESKAATITEESISLETLINSEVKIDEDSGMAQEEQEGTEELNIQEVGQESFVQVPAEEIPQEVVSPVQTVTYVIEKGDTLLNICRGKYGTADKINEICELNGIANADDIKIGQIILLPE